MAMTEEDLNRKMLKAIKNGVRDVTQPNREESNSTDSSKTKTKRNSLASKQFQEILSLLT